MYGLYMYYNNPRQGCIQKSTVETTVDTMDDGQCLGVPCTPTLIKGGGHHTGGGGLESFGNKYFCGEKWVK